MEFLGDAILNFLVGERLFKEFPTYDAGNMTTLRQQLVRGTSLARVGFELRLSAYGVEKKEDILNDTVEAITAAVYLDGGLDAVRAVIDKILWPHLGKDVVLRRVVQTPTMELIVTAADILQSPPQFIMDQVGPVHTLRYRVRVMDGQEVMAEAEHPDPSIAQDTAARAAIKVLNIRKAESQRRDSDSEL
jgi:ribonuclease-3